MVEDVLDARESWSRELDEKQAVYAEACRLLPMSVCPRRGSSDDVHEEYRDWEELEISV